MKSFTVMNHYTTGLFYDQGIQTMVFLNIDYTEHTLLVFQFTITGYIIIYKTVLNMSITIDVFIAAIIVKHCTCTTTYQCGPLYRTHLLTRLHGKTGHITYYI